MLLAEVLALVRAAPALGKLESTWYIGLALKQLDLNQEVFIIKLLQEILFSSVAH